MLLNRGVGIAADHLPGLFDRVFRADSARYSQDSQNHGLGLAIVAAIARMFAGHTLAKATGGTTRLGFTLVVQDHSLGRQSGLKPGPHCAVAG